MTTSRSNRAPELLNEAIAMHRRGRLDEAARAYRDVLAADAQQPDALHLLGVIAHQRGDAAEAARLIGQAIGVSPSVPAYHANLAEVYRALGQLERASGCCRTALRLDPANAEAANNLGLILLQQGNVTGAQAQFETALRLKPEHALACNNLANCRRALGDLAGAVAFFRQALAINPDLAEAHTNLGQMLLDRGDADEALTHCREAVRLRPDAAETHNNLGNVLRAQGKLAEARASYAEALSLNPDLALTHRNMGQALQEEGRLDEAIRWYEQALALGPTAAVHCFLASALIELENFDQAAIHYERAVQLDPDYAEAHNGLGWALHELGRFSEGLERFQTALRLRPDNAAGRCNLAYARQELGDFPEAERHFRAVIAQNPRHAGAHAQLATLLRGRLPEADRAALVHLLASPEVDANGRMNLHFALAQVADAQGGHAEAAAHLRQANALAVARQAERGKSYDPAEHRCFVGRLLATFTPAFFARTAGFGVSSRRPVFVVGLPRSATTLTEQILARHSQVHGAGELRLGREDFVALAGAAPFDGPSFSALAGVDASALRRTAETHMGRLHGIHADAERVVDKMPDNYLHLGLLAALFPRATFIHCRRDLRDVAVSCWMTHFRRIRWANDVEHIAERFAEYERVMAHWQRVLPVQILDVRYEETVTDLEGVARRLVAFCGLDWEPGCLAFHETQGPIGTASAIQVREPLYRRSVARWKHYERELADLFARLPAQDFG